MAITFGKYTNAVGDMVTSGDMSSADWYLALADTINVSDTVFTDGVTDLPAINGYEVGGNSASVLFSGMENDIYKLKLNNPISWAASNRTDGITFNYIILYNRTSMVPYCYWYFSPSINIPQNEHLSLILDTINGVFQVS